MPRPAPKYFGLGPAWMALLGATKRMPSAEATSPLPQTWAMGKAFCAATMPGIGGGNGFWPDEVLTDPGQPGAVERRLVGADQRLETDVAGLRDQRAAQAGGEILDTRMALADMGEGVGEARSRGNLQHDVRQVDLRHAGRDGRLQGDEAGRPFDLIERTDHQFVPAMAAFDPGRRIVRQVGGDLTPGAIQPGSEIAHFCLRIRATVERAADSQACGVPGFATQQAVPWVGVAHTSGNEDIAPLQTGAKASRAAKT